MEKFTLASFRVQSFIRGYHVYKEDWEPELNKEQELKCEPQNNEDPYAMPYTSYKPYMSYKPFMSYILKYCQPSCTACRALQAALQKNPCPKSRHIWTKKPCNLDCT